MFNIYFEFYGFASELKYSASSNTKSISSIVNQSIVYLNSSNKVLNLWHKKPGRLCFVWQLFLKIVYSFLLSKIKKAGKHV